MMAAPSLTVLIPCYNEAPSIAGVVREYRRALPDAHIVVVDNASSDDTAARAREAGAEVIFERNKGKAKAVVTAFSQIDTDLVLMVDGDGSYPAEGGRILLEEYHQSPTDMLTGIRCGDASIVETFRPFHQMGTSAFGRGLKWVFGFQSGDIFSGLRLFSRRFYQNVPILSRGFELELELTVQAIDKQFLMREMPVPFRARTEGTVSKLNTLRDGTRIARCLLVLFRDYRPLAFFSVVGAAFLFLSLMAGVLPVSEYFATGYVGRLPLAVLAASLAILASLAFQTGITLESSLRYHREDYQNRMRQFHRASSQRRSMVA